MKSLLAERLGYARRERLPASAFVFPDRRAWPIQSLKQAMIALRFIKSKRGDSKDWPTVKRAVLRKYPDLVDYAKELGL